MLCGYLYLAVILVSILPYDYLKKIMILIKIIRAFRNHCILGDTDGYWGSYGF